MKNTIFLLIVLVSNIIKSQSTIIDITASEAGLPDGYYLKDTNNILNQFEGTYVYSLNNIFKISLKKIVNQPVNSHFEDMIIGEYQYIENSIEKINTLSSLNTNYSDQFLKHSIASMYILENKNSWLWKCPECNSNEKRLVLRIRDRLTNRFANLLIRKTIENRQQVLKVKINSVSAAIWEEGTPEPPAFALPTGEFTMIKQ